MEKERRKEEQAEREARERERVLGAEKDQAQANAASFC